MLVIHRSRGSVVKGDHYVYTKQEADELGMVYDHWRHGQGGDWVISDDNYVLECLETREYYDSRRSRISRYDVYTVFYFFGCARVTNWARGFNVARHLKGMGTLDGKSWQERFVVSKRGRSWIKMAAAMMISKSLDLLELGAFMGFDKKYPESTEIMVKRYLRDNLIENAIIIQMSDFLNDKGVTYSNVLEEYKEVLKAAKKDGKYGDAIKILEKFERWTGLDKKIAGDKIDHSKSEDVVGSRVEKMLMERQQPKELIGGGQGLKVPASVSRQVTDGEGNRVEYVEVESEEES